MKKTLLTLVVIFLLYNRALSQIVLQRSDFPMPNEIYELKVLNQPFGISFNQTGANFTWNYHNLNAFISRSDTFYSPWQTPPVYWLFFNAFNTSVAQKLPNSFNIGPFLTVSEIYNFYYANNTKYELTGFGALMNNIPTPVKNDTNDVIYRFPLNYGNKDTSFSTFDINIPNIGYWKNNQRRYNHVDGWGTLIIPNDTFEVLRLKSEIFNSDSIRLDTLGGFSGRFNRPKQTEYKFLTKNGGIPVLQILTQSNQIGNENVVSVEYLKVEPATSRLSTFLTSKEVLVYPQPAKNQVFIQFFEKSFFSYSLQLLDMNGRVVYQDLINSSQIYELKNIPSGFYLLTLSNENHFFSQKILFTP